MDFCPARQSDDTSSSSPAELPRRTNIGQPSSLSFNEHTAAQSLFSLGQSRTSSTAAPSDTLAHEAELNYEMSRNRLEICQTHYQNRSKGTNKSYKIKVELWNRWCIDEKKFPDGVTVTAEKLALFVNLKVKTRENGKGGLISVETVKGWIAAIVDLYQQQKDAGMNSNPHPRNKLIKQTIENLAKNQYEAQRESHHDRGVGHMLDGFLSEKEVISMSSHFLNDNNRSGKCIIRFYIYSIIEYLLKF
jgi:hypothetical protein